MTSRSIYVAAGGCVAAIVGMRLPEADSPALVNLTDDSIIRTAVASVPAAAVLVVLLLHARMGALVAVPLIGFGLLGMLMFQPPVFGILPFVDYVAPSAGASLALLGYCCIFGAGVVRFRGEQGAPADGGEVRPSDARERQRS